jgi:spore coat protein U-like protein
MKDALVRLAPGALLAGVLLLLFGPEEAQAQSCSASVTAVDFGTPQLLTGTSVDVTGTATIACSNIGNNDMRVCVSFEAGSGGTSGTSRTLSGPSGATILYNLYSDAARTQRWGSRTNTSLGSPASIYITENGSPTVSRTVYGRLVSPQATAPPGTYTSTVSTTFRFVDDEDSCNGSTEMVDRNPSFVVRAELQPYCVLGVQNLDFGREGVIDQPIDVTTNLSVTCTKTTSYTVSLSAGGSGDEAARRMASAGRYVTYQIYKDSARLQPWTATGAGGTGTGLAQTVSVYGRVPAQATPPPGTYTDTIIVTVTY